MTDKAPYTETLNLGVQLRIQAKTLEDEAKAMRERANELFDVALTISGESELIHDHGTVKRKEAHFRESLDKTKLATILVNKGVQVDVVKASMQEATVSKEVKASIEFREKKSDK